ncbi:MarR family winged helix-turn-helix transcriptional regulator [Polluticaenibacter yanchengensis]|uniref:HTH-type transcriptional regulator SarZ n=1 Tax=Polluticaenibacter yanchengensis TaxID=3014562 RepID=A0ABT4UKZ0_9BACT|nr:MarR family transcriptional regulator [Chitinophagaceae bacterium LY-5]
MPANLSLKDQLCFSVYVFYRELMNAYRPLLDAMDITYTQYIVLLVLWETDKITVNTLGEKLKLDNGTITPLLKRLEGKNIITRTRSTEDERVVIIALTEEGKALKEKAMCIPQAVFETLDTPFEEVMEFKDSIESLTNNMLQHAHKSA